MTSLCFAAVSRLGAAVMAAWQPPQAANSFSTWGTIAAQAAAERSGWWEMCIRDSAKACDFSEPYYTDLPPVILVKAANADKYKTCLLYTSRCV